MEYKNYKGVVIYNPKKRIFSGHILDIGERIHFEGISVDELEKNFQNAVDICEKTGKKKVLPPYTNGDASIEELQPVYDEFEKRIIGGINRALGDNAADELKHFFYLREHYYSDDFPNFPRLFFHQILDCLSMIHAEIEENENPEENMDKITDLISIDLELNCLYDYFKVSDE